MYELIEGGKSGSNWLRSWAFPPAHLRKGCASTHLASTAQEDSPLCSPVAATPLREAATRLGDRRSEIVLVDIDALHR